jgi:hypothetical protein
MAKIFDDRRHSFLSDAVRNNTADNDPQSIYFNDQESGE